MQWKMQKWGPHYGSFVLEELNQILIHFTAFRRDKALVSVKTEIFVTFREMINARNDLDEKDKKEAINDFSYGYWVDRSGKEFSGFLWRDGADKSPALYINTRSMAPWLTGQEPYINNALYDDYGIVKKLFVLRQAARAGELGFGLVMAHERGKRDFLQSRFLSRFFGWKRAELMGNLYELWFFLKRASPFTTVASGATIFVAGTVALGALNIIPALVMLPALVVISLLSALFRFLGSARISLTGMPSPVTIGAQNIELFSRSN